MEDEKTTEIQASEVEGEVSDQSKREFVTKLLSAAGAVALAGVLTGSGSPASAEVTKGDTIKIDVSKEWIQDKLLYKFGKSNNGFRLVLRGGQLGYTMRQMGLVVNDPANATITIEFSS